MELRRKSTLSQHNIKTVDCDFLGLVLGEGRRRRLGVVTELRNESLCPILEAVLLKENFLST